MLYQLILIRGLQGSGKTTFARSLMKVLEDNRRDVVHLEADMYFTTLAGGYLWDPKLTGKAHEWCQAQALDAMVNRKGATIIVSNTFTTEKELHPYIELAKGLDYKVTILTVETTLSAEELAKRNSHGVPQAAIEKYRDRWQTLHLLAEGAAKGLPAQDTGRETKTA